MNREQRRQAERKRHASVFTKKYDSKEQRENAVMNYLGPQVFHAKRKRIADINRAVKLKKALAQCPVIEEVELEEGVAA